MTEDQNEREQHGSSYHVRSEGNEVTTPIVKPLWDKWSEPKTPSAALDLALEYALMEGLWCQNALFAIRTQFADPTSDQELERYKTLAQKGLTCGDIKACSIGILIMSVLDGPAVRQYFDPNPLNLPDTKARKIKSVEELLILHPIGGPATIFLAAGMAKIEAELLANARKVIAEEYHCPSDMISKSLLPDSNFESETPDSIIKHYFEGKPRDKRHKLETFRLRIASKAKQCIIEMNDEESSLVDLLPDGMSYHDIIIKGFRYACDFARKHKGLSILPSDD